MSHSTQNRVVLILDAGGTNFVFSAMCAGQQIVEKITLPAHADDLDKCLHNLVSGFRQVIALLDQAPSAISFSFPGPADYPKGIISSDLPNFPAFKNQEGFPLAGFLEEQFHIPVFINNDGDLFAYGEAMFGALPEINKKLELAASPKRYKNLLGLTLGTGFGAGIVINGHMLVGDNACGAEIFPSRNFLLPNCFVEESVSIRGIKRMYEEYSGQSAAGFSPKDIFSIAEGTMPGDQKAAAKAFAQMGIAAGDAIANIIAMIDGLIVIGGGVAGAAKYFLPALLGQLNGTIEKVDGTKIFRIPQKVYDLQKEADFGRFAAGDTHELTIPGSDKTIVYDKERRTGIAISKLGADIAIMKGAYAFAISQLDARSKHLNYSL